tara:strand:- start:272 stop:430 length:159 start_codon:yes stop_codon:yes gene_type:complete
MRKGIHKKYYPNGASYEGNYVDDKRHGFGIKTHADGTEIIKLYRRGTDVPLF